VVDALDPDAVAQTVASAEPEVIVHELPARVVYAQDQPVAVLGTLERRGREPLPADRERAVQVARFARSSRAAASPVWRRRSPFASSPRTRRRN
jgi:hypothetical protein